MTYDFVSCDYPLKMELFLTDATDPEFAGGQQVSLGNGSHEFLFNIRFGKNKHKKANEDADYQSVPKASVAVEVLDSRSVTESDGQKTAVDQQLVANAKTEEIIIIEDLIEVEGDLPDPNFGKPKPTFASGYYVVLGAFELYDNAIMHSRYLNRKGIQVKYGYVEDRALYYVYNLYTQDFEEAKRLHNQFIHLKDFQDAWVFEVK